MLQAIEVFPVLAQRAVPSWQPFSDLRLLEQNHLHVFRACLSGEFFQPECLSPDEKHRLGKIRSAVAQRRFVVSRGVLRQILGSVLNTDPEKITLDFGPHGKPGILKPKTDWRFNISHSGDVVLVVLACGFEVGVDVERIRSIGNTKAIVRRYFTASEIDRHESLPDREQAAAFFSTWTRKEAFLKMTGQGVSVDLKKLNFEAQHFATFIPCEGYVASLCFAGKSLPLKFWNSA